MRQTFKLNEIELAQFKRLNRQAPLPGTAWAFWKRVAQRRELDPASLISRGETFTALPVGHDRHWCFPIPLKCAKRPVYEEK